MQDWIQLVGPNRTVEILGVRLVGVNAESGTKLLLTLGLVVFVLLLGWVLRTATASLLRHARTQRVGFWIRQGIRLLTAAVFLIGLISVWFDDPSRLAMGLGLLTAGLAFALQKVVTSVAGYFVILRGKTFNVGDRIRMGGVRGDVIALDFIKTTIMEMGQPPPVQADDPAMWVQSREHTGRIVTVSNAAIFDEPVYNYSDEFPFLWEEMQLPISYRADRMRAERILLEAAQRHTATWREPSGEALAQLARRYAVRTGDTGPRVYQRLTENWLELTVRFISPTHAVRELKDALTRDVLEHLDQAGISVASETFEIVGVPPVRIEVQR